MWFWNHLCGLGTRSGCNGASASQHTTNMLSKESAEAIRTPKGLGLAIGLGLIAAPFTGGMSLAYMGCHVAVAAATQKKKPEQK